MKRLFTAMALLTLCLSLWSVTLDLNRNTDWQTTADNTYGVNVKVEVGALEFNTVKTKQGEFNTIAITGYTRYGEQGTPALPLMRKLIAVPLDAKVDIKTSYADMREYSLADLGVKTALMPVQPPMFKNMTPEQVKFVYDASAYSVDNWQNKPLAAAKELGVMRGVRLFALDIMPVAYNPVQHAIKVYNNIDVQVSFVGGNMQATNNLRQRTYSADYESVYNRFVINNKPFMASAFSSRDNYTRYPVKMLVISDPDFTSAMQPFIEWKTKQGIKIVYAEVGATGVGSTTTSIKSYIQNQYNAATAQDPAPTYILFVGDTDQVPVFDGSQGDHITDLNYARITGSDYMPEMMYSRFSASSLSQLTPQIDKTLAYEQLDIPSTDYMAEVTMIAGMDDYYASSHGNGQIHYGTAQYFNAAHGITSHTYYYPNSGSNEAAIVSDVSNGVGFINYTAHGDWNEWYSPNFSISDINGLQNNNEYTFAIGNCCLTNKFERDTCFGEAWLRASRKGAIGYIGGTNSTTWDEDYWWGVGSGSIVSSGPSYEQTGIGAYDGIFHEHGEDFSQWYTSAASLILCGNLAVTEGNGDINYYWEIYALMGDPTLQPFIGIPAASTAVVPETILMGQSTISFTAEPYAYVGLSLDGELLSAAIADANGNITIETPFTEPCTADLVITGQNTEPLITTVQVVPNSGPYVTVDTVELVDNADDLASNGETIDLAVSLNNIGSMDAQNITATLTSRDSYVRINTANAELNLLESGSTEYLLSNFSVSLKSNIPNGYQPEFELLIYAGEELWTDTFTITASAPQLSINSVTYGSDLIRPGDQFQVSLEIGNYGPIASDAGLASLFTTQDGVVIEAMNPNVIALESQQTTLAIFMVSVPETMTSGSQLLLSSLVTAGQYSYGASYTASVGVNGENFNNGSFGNNWQQGSHPWQITSSGAYEGTSCAVSSTLGNNQSATMSLDIEVFEAGDVSFNYRVSSESGYDFLKFEVDDQEQGSWSGNVSWTMATYPLTVGTHTLTWEYSKDYSQAEGSDCAWVDNIVLPSRAPEQTSLITATTDRIECPYYEDALQSVDFTLYNLGTVADNISISMPEHFTLNEGVSSLSLELAAGESRVITVNPVANDAQEITENMVIAGNDNQLTVELYFNGTLLDAETPAVPVATGLVGNNPNPFNPETAISFNLAAPANVELNIYNIKGQKVKTLARQSYPAGNHQLVWAGTDNTGKRCASGIYFYRLNAGSYTGIKKMLMLK